MSNPFEELELQLALCIGIAPTKVVSTVTKMLNDAGIRVIFAAVGETLGPYPQVEMTVQLDDVTSTVVSQVVTPLLVKAGVPSQMVAGVAGMAGSATVRFIDRYRASRTAKKQAVQEQPARAQQVWDPARPRKAT